MALSAAPAAAQYAATVQADSPIGYWRLDEAAGTVAVNVGSVGASGDLTYQNFPPGALNIVGAVSGNAAVALGSAGGANAPAGSPSTHANIAAGNSTDFAFASGQSFSVEYMIQAAPGNASTANAGIFTNGYDETQGTPWYLGRYNAGAIDFFVRTGANQSFVAAGAHGVADNRWHHVVNVYDGASNTLNVYVDGTLDGSTGGVVPDAFGTNPRPFTLGNHLNRALDAGLDEVAVYDQALSPTQVANHYAASGLATTAPRTTILAVDFGNSVDTGGGPGGTLAGFTAFEAAEGGSNPAVSNTIAGIEVTLSGYTHFRDYAPVSATYDRDELLSDMALRNSAGTMTLTLDGIAAGEYELRSYHVSTQFGGGLFDVDLLDANGASSFGTGIPVGRAGELSFLDIPFSVNGVDPVSFDFTGGSGTQHLSLNGFDLVLVPEPSAALLALLGLGAFLGSRHRRR